MRARVRICVYLRACALFPDLCGRRSAGCPRYPFFALVRSFLPLPVSLPQRSPKNALCPCLCGRWACLPVWLPACLVCRQRALCPDRDCRTNQPIKQMRICRHTLLWQRAFADSTTPSLLPALGPTLPTYLPTPPEAPSGSLLHDLPPCGVSMPRFPATACRGNKKGPPAFRR